MNVNEKNEYNQDEVHPLIDSLDDFQLFLKDQISDTFEKRLLDLMMKYPNANDSKKILQALIRLEGLNND